MSDNISSFLRRHGGAVRVGAVFLVGLLLILFSGIFEGNAQAERGETDLKTLCSSVADVGECEVMISYGASGEVVAVAVICEGGDSLSVRATLTDMIGSLYGIGSNRISVVKSK